MSFMAISLEHLRSWGRCEGEASSPVQERRPEQDQSEVPERGESAEERSMSGAPAAPSSHRPHDDGLSGSGSPSVYAVDVSPDATTIATGSNGRTVCVWSFTGQRLLDPLKRDWAVLAVRFSLDGRLLATGT